MDEKTTATTKAWITKARNDLDTARLIADSPAGHLDAAIYHCQQAAEKAVKAFLVFSGAAVERTHDVEKLMDIAMDHDGSFSAWLNEAAMLTPLATAYRYPFEGALFDPPPPVFEEALDAASKIYAHVLSRFPDEVHPEPPTTR